VYLPESVASQHVLDAGTTESGKSHVQRLVLEAPVPPENSVLAIYQGVAPIAAKSARELKWPISGERDRKHEHVESRCFVSQSDARYQDLHGL
jgi:hypothetical protein